LWWWYGVVARGRGGWAPPAPPARLVARDLVEVGASRVDQWDVEVRHCRHPLGEGVVSALAQLQVEVRGQLPANLVVDGHGVDVVHLRRIQAQVVEFVDRLGVDDELEVPRA